MQDSSEFCPRGHSYYMIRSTLHGLGPQTCRDLCLLQPYLIHCAASVLSTTASFTGTAEFVNTISILEQSRRRISHNPPKLDTDVHETNSEPCYCGTVSHHLVSDDGLGQSTGSRGAGTAPTTSRLSHRSERMARGG